MKIIDLTLPIENATRLRPVPLPLPEGVFTGRVYDFRHDSMAGTYIDLPGHIAETDDGIDAANYPLETLLRIPAKVIRLHRDDGSGAVTASDLQTAVKGEKLTGRQFQAVIINALGSRRFDQIAERSVYLAADAVEWLISLGIRAVVSDIYESDQEPQSVFLRFFQAGIATICCPINLDKLPEEVKLTVLFPRFAQLTQIPCRAIAHIQEE